MTLFVQWNGTVGTLVPRYMREVKSLYSNFIFDMTAWTDVNDCKAEAILRQSYIVHSNSGIGSALSVHYRVTN